MIFILSILADKIINYSLKLKKDDKVLITTMIEAKPLVLELLKIMQDKKIVAHVRFTDPEVTSLLANSTTPKRLELLKRLSEEDVSDYDAFISIKYSTNDYENKEIPNNILKDISEAVKEAGEIKTNKRKWILLNYPSKLDAYKAGMKSSTYFDYALNVMNVDYKELGEKIKPLKKLMEKTDNVRVLSSNTDISFSIKDMPVIPCLGEANLPDGEIYTAPIKDSVNGIITFNTMSPYQGEVFNNVCLKFENGKIIEATCDGDRKRLNEILDTDSGARYIGEFALGLNPEILYPMGDILFDEKIIGSIHMTPGCSYDDASNGNKSSIHWDMVLIQRKEYGGGEIYFDHTLVRKDGLFVLDELKSLNYNLE